MVAVQKTNNMKKRAPFKLRSGNKPSMAKIAGVSPMKQKVEFDPKKSEKASQDNFKPAYPGADISSAEYEKAKKAGVKSESEYAEYKAKQNQKKTKITKPKKSDPLKEYRKAMETPPNKRTKAQKELIMKINEQRAKEQNKAGMNIDEID